MARRRKSKEQKKILDVIKYTFIDHLLDEDILNILKYNLKYVRYMFEAKALLKQVKILEDTGCWVLDKDWSVYKSIKNKRMHRVSYTYFIGGIVEGRYICHKCDRKGCINFEHLFQGTPSMNSKDWKNKNLEYQYSRQMDMLIRRSKTSKAENPDKEIRAWNRYNDYKR